MSKLSKILKMLNEQTADILEPHIAKQLQEHGGPLKSPEGLTVGSYSGNPNFNVNLSHGQDWIAYSEGSSAAHLVFNLSDSDFEWDRVEGAKLELQVSKKKNFDLNNLVVSPLKSLFGSYSNYDKIMSSLSDKKYRLKGMADKLVLDLKPSDLKLFKNGFIIYAPSAKKDTWVVFKDDPKLIVNYT